MADFAVDVSEPGAIHLQLLGTPRLVLRDGRAHLLERHDAALLAMLVLHGPTPRHHALTMLWPEVATKTAQTNLRQRLFRLRRRAGAEVVGSASTLALAPGVHHDLDVDDSADAAADRNASPLLGALDYSDCGELGNWVDQVRQQQRSRWRDWLARAASELEADGRIADALHLAERLVIDDRTAEHAQRRLMRLHYRRGDRAAALSTFEQCRRALAEELGTTPGQETRELAALIARSDSLPAAVAATAPVAVLRPPVLIGREIPWAALEAAWQRGRVMLVRGESGIGKSRLAGDFAASRGAAETCRARPGDVGVPYALLVRLLDLLIARRSLPATPWIQAEFARLLPQLGAVPATGKLEVLRLRQALGAAMRAWHQQGLSVLLIDDLQFADDASVELLAAWLEEPDRLPVAITLRGSEASPKLTAWIANAGPAVLSVIDLGPLDLPQTAALVQSLAIPGLDAAAWATPLARHTGGNPLFLLETLMAELQAGSSVAVRPGHTLAAPTQIGGLLDRRLSQLTPAALRIARIAALAGPDFSVELAARVLGVHAVDLIDDWAALERGHVMQQGGFTHDLMQDAAARAIAPSIAEVLHRAIAEALEANIGGRVGSPARIAAHWQKAAVWDRAAQQFELAALAARAASRPADELQFWDSAAACHDKVDHRDAAFRVRAEAIEPAIVVGPPNQAAARADSLLAISRDGHERLAALLAQAKQIATGADFARSESIAAEALTLALTLARQLGDSRSEFLAATLRGVALTQTGHVDEGIALLEALATRTREAGDLAVEAEFCSAFGYALHPAGRLSESVDWSLRAAALAEQIGHLNETAINLGNAATLLSQLGRYEEGLQAAERAHALNVRLGEVQGIPYVVSQINLNVLYLPAGRYYDALAALARGLAASRGEAPGVSSTVENHMATAYLWLGQPARARRAMSPLVSEVMPSAVARRTIVETRIDAYSKLAQPERLIETLAALTERLQPIDRFGLRLAIATVLPAEEAAIYSRQVHGDALEHGQPKVAVSALIREADAWRRAGLPARAAVAARSALAEAATCRWFDIHAPEFWWMAVQALHFDSAEAEALQALRCGADWIRRALPHVPEPFMHGYLNRSPGVAELLGMARRWLD